MRAKGSPAGTSEAAFPAPGFTEFIVLFPFDGESLSQNQLGDPVALLDHVIGATQVEHDHADFAAVAGVDGAEMRADRMLQREPAARPDLHFAVRRKLDGE